MMDKRINYFFTILLIIFFVHIPTVRAENNSYKLGEAIGGYLGAVDMMEKFGESECGYILKKKHSFKKSLKEVLTYVGPKTAKAIKAFLKSDDFKMIREINKKNMYDFFDMGEKEGMDVKTLCGMWVSNISITYQMAEQKWIYAKKHYLKK